MKKILVLFVLLSVFVLTSCDDSTGTSIDELTLAEAVEGLKGGLIDCAAKSVTQLGTSRGFYDDTLVKILLPEEAQTVVNTVKNLPSVSLGILGTYSVYDYVGGSNFEENIIKAMNRSAEEAVKDDQTIEIFKTAISGLDFDSAFELLKGNVPATRADEEAVEDSPYAATIYLKRKTFDSLKTNFKPIIDTFLKDSSITGIGYSLENLWSTFVSGVGTWNGIVPSTYDVATPPSDLSDYIITKALNGLYYYLGVFEKNMREQFSVLFDAASAIYEAFQWASEQVDNLSATSGIEVLEDLPDYTF